MTNTETGPAQPIHPRPTIARATRSLAVLAVIGFVAWSHWSHILLDETRDRLAAVEARITNGVVAADMVLRVPAIYPDVNAALHHLKDKRILPGVTVTIEVADGDHDYAAPIVLDHPDGNRIKITGTTVRPVTFGIWRSMSGEDGSFALVMEVTSGVDAISVGDYVSLEVTGATDYRAFGASGVWEATGVDAAGGRVTLRHTANTSIAGPPLAGATTAARGTLFKTRLRFAASNGIVVETALGGLDKVALVGSIRRATWAGHWKPSTAYRAGEVIVWRRRAYRAVRDHVSDSSAPSNRRDAWTVLDHAGIALGYGGATNAVGATAVIGEVAVSGFGRFGVHVEQGDLRATGQLSSSGNGKDGLYAWRGGRIVATAAPALVSGNYGGSGVYAVYGGFIGLYGAIVAFNEVHGIAASYGGHVEADGSKSIGNQVDGFIANHGSMIHMTRNSVAAYNESSGVVANNGGAIEATAPSQAKRLVSVANDKINVYAWANGTVRCEFALTASERPGATDLRADTGGVILARRADFTGSRAKTNVYRRKGGFVDVPLARGAPTFRSDSDDER